jgi:predicted transposase/invertase (TIGR01784 family)
MTKEMISPLEDFAFAQIFGNRENLGTTKAFLKTLLDIPGDDYDRLSVDNPILKRVFRKDKMGIVDLKLTTKSGRIIHIEVQVNKKANFRNRILYYSSRLIGDQLQWGLDFEKLHQAISIVICDHILLEEEQSYINVYELRNLTGGSFTNLQRLVILELPKLPEVEDRAVWPWLRFFTCKTKEDYDMLLKKHPEMEKAVSSAVRIPLSQRLRYALLREQIRRMDEFALKKQIKIDLEESREDGQYEGREEGKLEIAGNLKKMGLPVSQIAEGTGLSPEVIDKL